MQKCIVGRKLGMTQLFDENGKFIPVTVVEAGPCVVVQKKTIENDGYEAVQIGFGEVTSKHVNKPLQGHFFANGDKVDVCGTSKGKGYAGTIKRYGNHSLKATHGTGPVGNHAGSNGACSDPSRVFKGKGLPGHMGAERVTVQNLEIVKVDVENNLIAIKGAIPGAKNGVVYITDSVKMA